MFGSNNEVDNKVIEVNGVPTGDYSTFYVVLDVATENKTIILHPFPGILPFGDNPDDNMNTLAWEKCGFPPHSEVQS